MRACAGDASPSAPTSSPEACSSWAKSFMNLMWRFRSSGAHAATFQSPLPRGAFIISMYFIAVSPHSSALIGAFMGKSEQTAGSLHGGGRCADFMGRRHRPGAVRRPDFRLEHVPRYREAVPAVRLTAAHVRLDPAASCLLPFAFCICPALPPAGVRTGRVLSGVAVRFLACDAAMKLLQVPMAVEGTIQ